MHDQVALPGTLFVLGGMGRDGLPRVETRGTVDADGGVGLLAYTSLSRLVTCCGERQGWVGVARDDVPELIAALGVTRIVLDLVLTEPVDAGGTR